MKSKEITKELLQELKDLLDRNKHQRAHAVCRVNKIKQINGMSVSSITDKNHFKLLIDYCLLEQDYEDLKKGKKQSKSSKKDKDAEKTAKEAVKKAEEKQLKESEDGQIIDDEKPEETVVTVEEETVKTEEDGEKPLEDVENVPEQPEE